MSFHLWDFLTFSVLFASLLVWFLLLFGGWAWCLSVKKLNIFQAIVVLEKTPESPLDCQKIKPANPKGNQTCIFIGRTDAEAIAPVLWPPDANSQLIGKNPDVGKDWRPKEKGDAEDEMVGWNHQLNGHDSEQTLGDSGGQRSLECCSPWGCK